MHTMRCRVSAHAHNRMESTCTCTQGDGEYLHMHTMQWRVCTCTQCDEVSAHEHNAMESVCTCTQCNGEYRYMYTPQWRVQAHAYAREHSYTLWSVCVALCPGIVLNTVTNKKLLCQTPNSLSHQDQEKMGMAGSLINVNVHCVSRHCFEYCHQQKVALSDTQQP